MLVYRSFVVGMLGAIALLIAMLPHELSVRRQAPEPLSVIHVSNSALLASPRPADAVAELLAQATGGRLVIVIDP
jgi:hypothetical protein